MTSARTVGDTVRPQAGTVAGLPARGSGERPYRDALRCLREAGVPYALMRDDAAALATCADLDLLLDDRELGIAFAALERAGFLRKHTPQHRRKWVFIRYEAERPERAQIAEERLESLGPLLTIGFDTKGGSIAYFERLREPIRSGQTIYGFTAHVSAEEVRFTHEDTVCVRKLTR